MAKRNSGPTFEQVNAAYGLVLGAFFSSQSSAEWHNSRAGWRAWNEPKVQAAAMRHAHNFLAEVSPLMNDAENGK